ncbi:unnamed protein product, partial [Mesorhabditis belari]|uniref:Uncharacterized protein n=1 Tax=Mesorhabditis belari TaxID=2138241 RepID=A0AAF3EPX5_9BILA
MKTTPEAPITVNDFKVTPKRSRSNAKKSMSFSIASNAAETRKPAHVVIPMEIKETKGIFIPRESISGADDYPVLRKRDEVEIPKQSKMISNNEEIFIPRESKSKLPPSSEMRKISDAAGEKEGEIKKFRAKTMTRNGIEEKHEESTWVDMGMNEVSRKERNKEEGVNSFSSIIAKRWDKVVPLMENGRIDINHRSINSPTIAVFEPINAKALMIV